MGVLKMLGTIQLPVNTTSGTMFLDMGITLESWPSLELEVSDHVYNMSIVAALLTIILLLLAVIGALIFVAKLAKETFFTNKGEMRGATTAQQDANDTLHNMNHILANEDE